MHLNTKEICRGLKNLVCSCISIGVSWASGRVSMGEDMYNMGWKRRVMTAVLQGGRAATSTRPSRLVANTADPPPTRYAALSRRRLLLPVSLLQCQVVRHLSKNPIGGKSPIKTKPSLVVRHQVKKNSRRGCLQPTTECRSIAIAAVRTRTRQSDAHAGAQAGGDKPRRV